MYDARRNSYAMQVADSGERQPTKFSKAAQRTPFVVNTGALQPYEGWLLITLSPSTLVLFYTEQLSWNEQT